MGRPGQAPGVAVYTGEPRKARVKLDLLAFAPRIFRVTEDLSPEEASQARAEDRICWIDIDGIHDAETVKGVGQRFGMHPLSVEDILDPDGRPKVEEYPDYLYLVARMVTRESISRDDIETEQISLILGRDFVLTFQPSLDDGLSP